MFLTDENVKTLTGYKQPGKQKSWLTRWGVRHFVASDGHPRVLISDIESNKEDRSQEQPDLSFLKK